MSIAGKFERFVTHCAGASPQRTSIYSDPASPDINSLVLQLLAAGADAVMTYGTDDIGARIVEAAQQQDGVAKMKWPAPTSFYTVRFPGAIDTKYWNDRYWVNAELDCPAKRIQPTWARQ
jgi:branched-chain amino acid transport system substrate-binding protein